MRRDRKLNIMLNIELFNKQLSLTVPLNVINLKENNIILTCVTKATKPFSNGLL